MTENSRSLCNFSFGLELSSHGFYAPHKHYMVWWLTFSVVYSLTHIAGCGGLRPAAGLDTERDPSGQHPVRQEIPPNQV